MHCSTSGTGLVLLPSNGTSCDRYDHGSFPVVKINDGPKRILRHILGRYLRLIHSKSSGTEYAFFREVFKIASRSGDLGWVELEAAKAPIFFG